MGLLLGQSCTVTFLVNVGPDMNPAAHQYDVNIRLLNQTLGEYDVVYTSSGHHHSYFPRLISLNISQGHFVVNVERGDREGLWQTVDQQIVTKPPVCK